jgi:hypothetical protein
VAKAGRERRVALMEKMITDFDCFPLPAVEDEKRPAAKKGKKRK